MKISGIDKSYRKNNTKHGNNLYGELKDNTSMYVNFLLYQYLIVSITGLNSFLCIYRSISTVPHSQY